MRGDVLLLLGGGGVIKCERYGRRLGAGWGVLAALRQRMSTGRGLVWVRVGGRRPGNTGAGMSARGV